MSWRKHENHRQETKAVKVALKEANINAVVRHSTGTAWGWLEINIGAGQQFGEHKKGDNHLCHDSCQRCKKLQEMRNRVFQIVREITGRNGDYSGEILVLTQDRWDKKQGKSVPILHPDWETK